MTFSSLGVPSSLVAVLTAQGIESPFPIQTATLPDTLTGRDVLGRGRTGSGKTLAFALPMVARLAASTGARRPARPRGLILAPTRELATQIAATLEPLAKAERLSITTVFGGVSQGRQVSALNGGVDILVACPGRLEDLLKQRVLSLDGVEITVLDEADHMADLGFLPGVKRIMDKTPARGQRMVELLKQPQYSPYPVEDQVVSIWAGSSGELDEVPVEDVRRFESEFLTYLKSSKPQILQAIAAKNEKLSNETEGLLKAAVNEFKDSFEKGDGTLLRGDVAVAPLDRADVGQETITRHAKG